MGYPLMTILRGKSGSEFVCPMPWTHDTALLLVLSSHFPRRSQWFRWHKASINLLLRELTQMNSDPLRCNDVFIGLVSLI